MDSTDIFIKQLHDTAFRMLSKGFSDEQIIIELKKMGAEDHYAEVVLSNAYEIRSDRKGFYNYLLSGIFVLAAGIVISIGSYVYAQSGWLYYVSSGIIVYGIFNITKAVILFRN